MIFTVELRTVFKEFRLQKNGEWRNLNNNKLPQESDFQTSNPAEVTRRTPYGCEIEIENILYKVSPNSDSVSARDFALYRLNGESLVFR